MSEKNDLLDFFQEATVAMQSGYNRISRRSKSDPGTAGDEGEENWVNLLREWLPAGYHIVTKGQILFPDGSCSPQIDIFVLTPEYPLGLIKRNIKKYPAHCVAAAFECKLTLRASHLEKTFQNSAFIKNRHLFEQGSPYRELNSPIIYGLLAHRFDGKAMKNNTIFEIINKKITNCDKSIIKHPKEMLDFICVANIGTWTAFKSPYRGPSVMPGNWEKIAHVYGGKPCASTSYILHQAGSFEQIEDFTPIGTFITSLTRKLAWTYPALQGIARYYDASKISGTGEGINARVWNPREIYSAFTFEQVSRVGLVNGVPWHEWSCALL
jgi:uncharacterized protein DUF6602